MCRCTFAGQVALRSINTGRLVGNIDVAPTIYRATGIRPGYTVDGRSLFQHEDGRLRLAEPRKRLLLEYLADDRPERFPRWAALVTKRRYYLQWQGAFVEDYSRRDDPYMLNASNTRRPRLDALLSRAVECRGNCP